MRSEAFFFYQAQGRREEVASGVGGSEPFKLWGRGCSARLVVRGEGGLRGGGKIVQRQFLVWFRHQMLQSALRISSITEDHSK